MSGPVKRLLAPGLRLPSITAITPELCDRYGLRGLILDADNTLVPRQQYVLDELARDWIRTLQASGRRLCILSNSHKIRKVAAMAAPHGMAAICLARKPALSGFRRALAELGTQPHETAMVGDQLLTDIVGGNRAGMLTIMVDPLSTNDFVLYRFMRPLERRLARRWQPLTEAVERTE